MDDDRVLEGHAGLVVDLDLAAELLLIAVGEGLELLGVGAEGEALRGDRGVELADEVAALALGPVGADARLQGGQHHEQHREAGDDAHGEQGRDEPALQAEGAPGGHPRPSSPPKA